MQLVERGRIDHRAGQDMRADLGTLLHHDDGEIGIELLQPDRGRQAGRPGADDHDVEFHGFARGQLFVAHDLVSDPVENASNVRCFRFLREDNHGNAFRWRARGRPKLIWNAMISAMTPEPAPTVQQLLAFYLEAGVDCALGGGAGRPACRS